jgi:hypothetical protein
MDIDSVIVEREVEDELIWITVSKYALFMSYGKVGIDAKSLYEHYQFTSLLQKTNSVWALDTYCRQGLDWGRDRYDKAKALLKDLDLIEEWRDRDEKGRLGTKYVKVKTKRVELEPVHLSENPQVGKTTCGKTTTNALTKKVNALTKKRKGFIPPTLEEIEEYNKEKKLSIDCEFFYEFFNDNDWIDSRGNKVKSWKQKMLTWSKYNNGNNGWDNLTTEQKIKLLDEEKNVNN